MIATQPCIIIIINNYLLWKCTIIKYYYNQVGRFKIKKYTLDLMHCQSKGITTEKSDELMEQVTIVVHGTNIYQIS